MFIYDKIPDIEISEIVKGIKPELYARFPKKLSDFCRGLESDPDFLFKHTRYHKGTKQYKNFYGQVLEYLELVGGVRYSMEDSLEVSCIQRPLAITHYGKNRPPYQPLKVKDIADIYELDSGKIWLPPHHVGAMTRLGKIPDTVGIILHEYIEYASKCVDKNQLELQKELKTLLDYKVISSAEFNGLMLTSKQNEQEGM